MSRYEDCRNQTFVFININDNFSLSSLTGGTYCEDEHINIKERIKQQKYNLVIMMRRVRCSSEVCVNAEVPMILVTVRDTGGVT